MDQNLDEKTIQELQDELHTEIYPGTEIMRDVGVHHFVKSGTGTDNVLVPQPSDASDDPLNWSPTWKFFSIFSVTLVSFTQGFGPLALAPLFGDYIELYDSNLTDVIQFTGVAILVLGFSNFIWVPITTCFGRRPTAIISMLICVASAIWRAQATSYNSFMGACVLNGIGAGPAETLQPVVTADIFFLHERGRYNTLYFTFYFGSLMVSPICSGAIAQRYGVVSFWWLYLGLCLFTTLCCVFLFPETRFKRDHEHSVSPVAKPVESIKGSTEEVAHAPGVNDDIENATPLQPSTTNADEPVATHVDPYLGRGGPKRYQWKLWQEYSGSIIHELILPWKLMFFPIVALASFTVSWTASSFLTINLTQTQVFAAPPYLFDSQTIGFFNFAILIGGAIGLATAGPLSDYVAAVLTRRNRGIREPEMRLLSAVPYVIIMLLGNFVVAFGYQYQWDWKPIVIVGYTCAGIQVAALPSIYSTYAVDSYKPVAGALFVAITVNKNVWGYGFSKFITPWSIQSGYLPPIMTNMSLIALWCGCGILFWFKGKTFRKWTRNSPVHSM